MNLKEKLARLDRQTHPTAFRRPEEVSEPPVQNLPDGEEMNRPEGRFYRMTKRFPANHTHGAFEVGALCTRSLDGARFIVKEPEIRLFSARDLLFLDTETTGLSGGVGTLAFLIGLGFFDDDSFVVEQLFARNFREERAALAYLLERTRHFSALVTYNGKSFDWPLLLNRWIFNRFSPPEHLTTHLDLLYFSRRLWRRTIGECSLGNIEKQILRVRRFGDVPGYLVPQIYFDFLRSRDARELQKVFYHNQMDILSLVTLLDFQLDILDGNLDGKTLDPVSLGKLFVEMEEMPLGRQVLEKHRQQELQTPFREEVALFLARLHKRNGNWPEAVALWENLLESGKFLVEPYEELAKFYEHRQQDNEKALNLTNLALRHIAFLEKLGRGRAWQDAKEALEYRRNRLERKRLKGKKE